MDNTPQFGTAEYAAPSTGEVCKACHQPVGGMFYRAHAAILCGSCAEHLQREIPQDSHAAFVRGIIFGLGGFIVGLVLYAGFTILTGIEIGFVSLAVGWLVGKAIMMGSSGVGGRRYQIVAVLLTYAAVSLAFIPIMIHYMRSHPTELKPPQTNAQSASKQSSAAPAPGQNGQSSSSTRPGLATFLGKVILLGLASPFLQLSSGVSSIIGLFILFIGMQFAWKITRGVRVAITGPYNVSSAAKG